MEQNPELSTRNNEHLELVFKEFQERRAGLIKALTTDFESFYDKCAPGGERLCLYGLAGESWEVSPLNKIPPEIPNPAAGINLSRDRMLKSDWAKLVAELSDSWLLAVAFYDASLLHLDKSDRMQLFEMINNLPTLLEILTAEFEERVFNNSNPEQHKQGNNTSDELEIRGKQQNLWWLLRRIMQKVLVDIIQHLHEIFPWNLFRLYRLHW